jgi:ATP-dependent DNA ligase
MSKIGKNELTAFPTLFKKASSGATVEWNISVEGNTIVKRWGQTGGAIQETRDVIKEGKNAGKANATTAEEQAVAEATAQWQAKQKKDYNQDRTKVGQASELIEGGVLPMLAKKFSEDGDKIKYPCAGQPKFDGHRCIGVMDAEGKCTLWSRTRKPIRSMPHIIKAVEAQFKPGDVTDGELYVRAYHDKFEEITRLIRPDEPREGHELVEYHIYDMVDTSKTFRQHNEYLQTLKLKAPLMPVETYNASDEDELMLVFERLLSEKYEGCMARNWDSKYVNKRSADLQKIKQFSDAEYRCTGVREGRGKLAGHAIFVLRTPEGKEFNAKMKGDTSELKKYFDHPETVVGHEVTVKYQGISSYGIPRFPVAWRVVASL